MRSLGVCLTPSVATGVSSTDISAPSTVHGDHAAAPLGVAAGSAVTTLVDGDAGRARELVVDLGPILDSWLTAEDPTMLSRVTAVRIAPSENSIRTPFDRWPDRLAAQVDGGWVWVKGGVDMHRGGVGPLDRSRLALALELMHERDSDTICIAATGALLDPRPELEAAEYLLALPDPPRVVMAHLNGGRRFFERERATLVSGALMPSVEKYLDALTEAADAHGVSLAVAGADGARLTSQDARSVPSALFGTTTALAAQGAAKRAGAGSATLLVWTPQDVRVLNLDEEILRTRQVRSASALSSMRLTQRHAAQARWLGPSVPGRAAEPVGSRPLIAVGPVSDGGGPSSEFGRLTRTLRAQHRDLTVVAAPLEELAALGAAASIPQCEIERFAILDGPEDAATARRENLRVAQGKVVGTIPGEYVAETILNQCQPISFLNSGPFLVHTVVVGRPAKPDR